MIVGSLCTGYGGLEQGLKMVFPQARLAWVADNDKAASVLLAARYPGVPNLGDIKAVDWSTVERVDVLAAGIPCQPHSLAGKGLGKDDERDLVDAFIHAVRELRPKIVILENVPGFKRGGLPRVLGALASMGFHARWHSVRASEAGASHRRERLIVLAYPADDGQQWSWLARLGGLGSADGSEVAADAHGEGRERGGQEGDLARGEGQASPDSRGSDEQWPTGQRTPIRQVAGSDGIAWGVYEQAVRRQESVFGRLVPAPTEIGPRGNVRLAARFPEWMMGVPDGWVTDFGFSRKDTFRLIGNGVVGLQAALAIRGLIHEESNSVAAPGAADGISIRAA